MTAEYCCNRCRKFNKMRFKESYKPFRKWLMTCRLCRSYTLQHLLTIWNPGQSGTGPVFR